MTLAVVDPTWRNFWHDEFDPKGREACTGPRKISTKKSRKMELILTERSEGSYGAPALHGMLTASVVGPQPVPMDWILQTVLSPPESEAIGLLPAK